MNPLCFWVGFRQNIIEFFFIPGFRPKMKRQTKFTWAWVCEKISRIEILEQQSIKDKMSVSNAVIDAEKRWCNK